MMMIVIHLFVYGPVGGVLEPVGPKQESLW